MKFMKIVGVVVGCLVVLTLAYGALLARPEPLFAYAHTRGDFVVHSRTPLGLRLDASLDSAGQRLAASPLHRPRQRHRVFVAGSWEWYSFLAGPGRRAMAKNYELGNSIFVPAVDTAAAQIVHFDGRREGVANIVAHEAAHSDLQREAGGAIALWRLPFWKKEGYPEMVAYGDTLDAEEMHALLTGNVGGLVNRRPGVTIPRRYVEAEAVWRVLLQNRGLSVRQVLDSSLDARAVLKELARSTH